MMYYCVPMIRVLREKDLKKSNIIGCCVKVFLSPSLIYGWLSILQFFIKEFKRNAFKNAIDFKIFV